MTKDQVRLQTANGTIVRLSKDEADRIGSSYKAVGADSKDVSKMKVDELKAYAEERSIDLGGASKKAEILKVIADHDADSEDDGSDDED